MQLRQIHDIQYQMLPGTQRRTTDIVIERNCVVQVRAPKHMTPEQVEWHLLKRLPVPSVRPELGLS